MIEFNVTIIFAVIVLVVTCLLHICRSIRRLQDQLPVRRGASCLLVIAHPDDETMFFAPTIIRLTRSGCRVFLLSVTTGDADGIGEVRKPELRAAVTRLGIRVEDTTVFDITEFRDGPAEWTSYEKLAHLILRTAQSLDCECVLTFDDRGVSGHPNHIGCYNAAVYLRGQCERILSINHLIFMCLETVNIARKYSSLFDILTSWMLLHRKNSSLRFLYVTNPISVYRAMRCHHSQLVWFRYLYLLFSRYVVINTLKELPFVNNKKVKRPYKKN